MAEDKTEKDLPPRVDGTKTSGLMGTTGAAGTKIFSGLVLDDYNADLQGLKAVPVYDKMRRSEPVVQASVLSCELPIRGARWYISPASENPMHVALADFVHDSLFNFGTQTFDDFCRLSLGMLWAGFSWLEKIFDYDDRGYLMWREFAYRHQNTVWRWNMSETNPDDLQSVTQLTPPSYAYHTIPVDKLLVYSYRREGNNFQGISMLRPAYKPWFILDYLTKVANIGYERMAGGLPVMEIPDGAEDKLVQLAKDTVENLRMGDEQAGVVHPASLGFSILEIGGKMMDHLNAYLESMRLQIARSVLASFMNMPGSATGSFALSKDHSQLFLDSLSSSGDQVAEEFNLNAIPQLLNLNFAGLRLQDMPRLEHSRIGQRDTRWLGRSIGELARNGLLHPDPELEDRLREIFDLPDIPEEQANQPVNNPTTAEDDPLIGRKPAPDGVVPAPVPPTQLPAQTITNAPPNLPAPKIVAAQKWRPSTRLARERRPYVIHSAERKPRSRSELNDAATAETDALERVIKTAMRHGRENAKAVIAQQSGE